MTFKTQLFDALAACAVSFLEAEGLTFQLYGYSPVGDCVRVTWDDTRGEDSLDFPDQEVEITAEGDCRATDGNGDTYTLTLQMTRPITRADVQAWQTAQLDGRTP